MRSKPKQQARYLQIQAENRLIQSFKPWHGSHIPITILLDMSSS